MTVAVGRRGKGEVSGIPVKEWQALDSLGWPRSKRDVFLVVAVTVFRRQVSLERRMSGKGAEKGEIDQGGNERAKIRRP